MPFNKLSLVVDGQNVSIDFDEDMQIGDISEDMTKVASQVAFWGAVWAAAESESKRADAAYRQWRADQTNMVLEADPKMAEWKARAKVEELKTFVELKSAISQAEANAVSARQVCEAFKIKAHVLQSFGAHKRAEMFADDVHTSEPKAKSAPSDTERSARVSAMKTINRKKSKSL